MASKRNSQYWRERFVLQETLLLEDGQAFYDRLERQYSAAIQNVQADIDAWYRRFADNNQISYAEAKKLLTTRELEEFRWTVEEYIKRGKENAVDGQWMKRLENASARVHVSRLESLQLQMQQHVEVLFGNQLDGMDKTMRHILTEGYYHTAFEIQRGIGVGWGVQGFDPRRLDTIIRKPWAPDGSNFSEKVWGNRSTLVYHLETDFTRSLLRGDGPDKAIDALAKEMNRSKYAAGRLVMTESAYFASAGQKECFKELGVDYFEIVETLDSDTCEICQSLDGTVCKMSDYEPGVTAPPFHPWCRGCTCPYFKDDFGKRAARDHEGKVYYAPANMTYGAWLEKQGVAS